MIPFFDFFRADHCAAVAEAWHALACLMSLFAIGTGFWTIVDWFVFTGFPDFDFIVEEERELDISVGGRESARLTADPRAWPCL